MRLRARLVEHWPIKLLALLFAVAVWTFVASQDEGESVFTIPLQLTDVPPETEATVFGEGTVDVRVQGLRRLLGRLDAEDLRVEVSLRDARPGPFAERILVQDVTAPRSVRVLTVSPSRVRGTLRRSTPEEPE